MGDDDRRIYDLVARRFLAIFHPDAEFENTRDRDDRRRARLPHPRQGADRPGLARRLRRAGRGREERRRGRGARPAAAEARARRGGRARPTSRSLEKETKPPRRYSDASLLGAMEAAGKLVDDEELREAMTDSGHRHAGDARGDHRAPDRRRLHRARRPRARADREGDERHPPARRPPADRAGPRPASGSSGSARSRRGPRRARSS